MGMVGAECMGAMAFAVTVHPKHWRSAATVTGSRMILRDEYVKSPKIAGECHVIIPQAHSSCSAVVDLFAIKGPMAPNLAGWQHAQIHGTVSERATSSRGGVYQLNDPRV